MTGARKKDIAWDVMKSMAIQSEQEIFLKYEKWYQNGAIPRNRKDLYFTERGIESKEMLIYAKAKRWKSIFGAWLCQKSIVTH